MSNKLVCLLVCLVWGSLGTSARAEPPPAKNVLLLCVDDLRPELACYGQAYVQSPHIDQLASEGVRFSRHFVQAPTCGASRYAMLTGCYGGASNNALFQRSEALASGKDVPTSMPGWFRQHGYRAVSIGKVSHHPGGRGGRDWDEPATLEMPNSWDEHLLPAGAWQHPRGAMHGLANGEIRENASDMDLFQSAPGGDEIYPDGLTTNVALEKLDELTAGSEPFFLAVGLLKPHLPLGAPAEYMKAYADINLPEIAHSSKPAGRTTWHGSGEFMKYNRWGRNPNTDAEFAQLVRRHYAACVTYSDALIGRIIAKLKSTGEYENTIIVVWGDHGWHLGEHAIWGKHALFEESLHSPLIINAPGIDASTSTAIVESVDLFPTLCELAGLPSVECSGNSLVPLMQGEQQSAEANSAVSYTGKARTLRTDNYRLILHNDGYAELYSHADGAAGETENLAQSDQETVKQLSDQLQARDPR